MNDKQSESEGRSQMSRRQFLAWAGLAAAGGVAAAGGYIYLNNEADDPVIEKIPIPLKGLPPSLEGFTIAVLADFHLYPFTQLELIEKSVAMANALEPDVTVLLGDYVWHEVEAIFDLAPVLAGLNAKHGVYAATGNHDYWTDINIISVAMKEAGLPLFVNEGVPITKGDSELYLAILDDGWSGNPDLPATMRNMTSGATPVLLSHEPDLADKYSLDKRIGLQLSGHSHGGQVRFPGVGALILPYMAWKYDMGLYRVNDMWLYTNRGLGVTSEPVRFNCPPEITEITLVRA
jgi:predicted MPP superfamily phosphohydrolase